MEKSKVYFTDFRTYYGGPSLPQKLKKLIQEAGIGNIDFEGKIVAIKMHFGELGNMAHLRPQYVKAVVDVIKKLGGKPFLTDCNTLYVGSRKNALEHLECAWENGFSPLSTGCPIIIADGIKGTDDVDVPVVGGEYCKTAKIGRAVMDADIFISLSHFKGHEDAGFGGCLKNIGMGCGSRAGKADMHNQGKPTINQNLCRGCKSCQKICANNGLSYNEETHKMSINRDNCLGCGRCLGVCNFDAISFSDNNAVSVLTAKIAEYTKAVIDGRDNFHINIICDVSPYCDCHAENDAPILPDIGMFASFDPIALDQACVDACLAQTPYENSQLGDNMRKPEFEDHKFHEHHDHFKNSNPESDWRNQLEHGEKIGLGSREYELVEIK